MAINELWIPVISEGVKWAIEKARSKKSLSVKVSELEEEVRHLTECNEALYQYCQLITKAILDHLQSTNSCSVNAGTIIYIGSSDSDIITNTLPAIPLIGSNTEVKDPVPKEESFIDVSTIFDGIEEDIEEKRKLRPSERGLDYDNP